MTPASWYIHVPFCASVCPYCDFFRTVPSAVRIEQWLDVVGAEIRSRLEPDTKIDTLYIGGGTPSMLSDSQFFRLVKDLLPHLQAQSEVTVECNPESLSTQKLAMYRQCKVNRISLGVQSFNAKTIEKLGRHHTPALIEQAVEAIKEAGIDNISIDLMFAVPGQSMADVQADLARFFRLDIAHLSIYSLILEEGSVFGRQGLQAVDEDLEADEYEWIVQTMKGHGYCHYEISSFARDGKLSRHNLAYWLDQDFVGIGCGASGRENRRRYTNAPDLLEYIEKGPRPEYEPVNAPFEAVMMGLRTCFGVDLASFFEKYGLRLEEMAAPLLAKYDGDLMVERGALKTTESGMEKLNSILVDFLALFE